MELSGKIKVLGATQQVSASFKKRELVIESSEQYPQFISINFTQDKCDLLNDLKVGQEVNIGINIRGREWVNPQGESKYFNDIQGWKINKLSDKPVLDEDGHSKGNEIPDLEDDGDLLPF